MRDRGERGGLEQEVLQRSGALEVQLRVERVSRPIDRESLRESPTILATALGLMEAARGDASLLDSLVPADLASGPEDRDERRAYLQDLLAGLPDELIERSLASDDA